LIEKNTGRFGLIVIWIVFLSGAISCIPLVQDVAFDLLIGDRFGADPGEPEYLPQAFVNWETPHVSPLDVSPDGSTLFAVNTPDNRVELFDLESDMPLPIGSVSVGLDPVSVRARSDSEIWVANHISDSISIVDVARLNVVKTIRCGDEPTDIGFAAGRAFVVCSQLNEVWVYNLSDLNSPPTILAIAGEDPRAVAVSPDGLQVYVAIFESGNDTSIVPHRSVSDPVGPYGGQNPVPISNRPFPEELMPPTGQPPRVAHLVRKDPQSGAWLDDNQTDWSQMVSWNLHDHDLAVINAESLEVGYVSSLMNLNMNLAVLPDGQVTVIGTEATNHIRFEPELTARFVHSVIGEANPAAMTATRIEDLNPHLAEAYASRTSTLPDEQRALSIADPRAIVWSADGRTGYVAGMGTNNVIVVDASLTRQAQFGVGEGPTGLRLDEQRGRLYVLNKFEATISVIDTGSLSELDRVAMFDPTPRAVRNGRPMLYDARRTSGLGVTACASCHVDARLDQLSWDLGNPDGQIDAFNQVCDDIGVVRVFDPADCEDFHPLKGPMTTQTLQGIIGTEPLHWRGDRNSLKDFNPAFVSLNGNDRPLTDEEMAAFEAFLETIRFPPNPFRNLDNSLKSELFGGNPIRGQESFLRDEIDGNDDVPIVSCNRCHQLPIGTQRAVAPAIRMRTPQSMKVPQLRNLYEKTGFSKDSQSNNRGFGFAHSGEMATLEEFLSFEVFLFGEDDAGRQKRQDVISFIMSLSVDTHAAIGQQATLDGTNNGDPRIGELLDLMLTLADTGQVGLVVKGWAGGEARGYAYVGDGVFQSDRAWEQRSAAELRAAATSGNELTWTVVPLGSAVRIGIDRDSDGVLDGDE
jgi:YVTN family beta-propeller protein